MTCWITAKAQLEALLDGCTCPVSCLANASALISQVMAAVHQTARPPISVTAPSDTNAPIMALPKGCISPSSISEKNIISRALSRRPSFTLFIRPAP